MGTGVLQQTAAVVTVVTAVTTAAAAAAAAAALSRRGLGLRQQPRQRRFRLGLDAAPLGRLRRRIVDVRSSGGDGSDNAVAEAESSPLLQEQVMLQVSGAMAILG